MEVRPRVTRRRNGKLGRTTNHNYTSPWGQLFRSFASVLDAVKSGVKGYSAKRGRPCKGEERPSSKRRSTSAASSSFGAFCPPSVVRAAGTSSVHSASGSDGDEDGVRSPARAVHN